VRAVAQHPVPPDDQIVNVGDFRQQLRHRADPDILSLVRHEARDRQNERHPTEPEPGAQRARVAPWRELAGVGAEVDRGDGGRDPHADLPHDVAGERRRPARVGDDAERAAEDGSRTAPLERAAPALPPFVEQVAAIHVQKVGHRQPAIRPPHRVAAGAHVAAMHQAGALAALVGEGARPAHLVRQPFRLGEREGLAPNAIRLPGVEHGRAGRRHGGHDERLGRETPAELDVTTRHSAEVGRVVLGDEEVRHVGLTYASPENRWAMRWS
jgi:hypothetical protein